MATLRLSVPRGERLGRGRLAAATLSILVGAARSLSGPILTGATIVCGALCAVRAGVLSAGAVYPAEQSLLHLHHQADAWLSSREEFGAVIAVLVLVSALANAQLVSAFGRGQSVLGFGRTVLFVLVSVVIYGPIGPLPDTGRAYRLTLAEIRHAERLTATAQSLTRVIQTLAPPAPRQVALGFERLATDTGRERGAIDATAAALVGGVDRAPVYPPTLPVVPNVTPATAHSVATRAQRAERQAFEGLVLVIKHLSSGAVNVSNPDLRVGVKAVLGELTARGFDAIQTRMFLTRELTPTVVDAVAAASAKSARDKPVTDGPLADSGSPPDAALARARGLVRGARGPDDEVGPAILEARTDSAGSTDARGK